MDEKILNQYYQKIGEKIDKSIPCKWEKAAIYVEDTGDCTSYYMYFREKEDGEYIYGEYIPERYHVDEGKYDDKTYEIMHICSDFRKEFKKAGEEPWNIFKFYIKSSGEFNAEFGYEYDEKIDDSVRALVWSYLELGVMPEGDYEERRLDEYVNRETGELKKKL